MKAILKNYRQSPRKVRLVARSVRGKTPAQAIMILDFMPKRAAEPIMKLIASAVANAKVNDNVDVAELVIKGIEINKGVTLKRFRPRARGSAYRINKRTSHIVVTLEKKASKGGVVAEAKAESKASAKKVAVKKTAVKKVSKPKVAKPKLEAKS